MVKWKLPLCLLMAASLPVFGDAGVAMRDHRPPVPSIPDMKLYLATTVNGREAAALVRFVRHAATLCAGVKDLRALGFRLDNSQPRYCLDALTGVRYRYDAALQRVDIQAPLKWLNLPVTRLNAADNRTVAAVGGSGMLLNYDLYATRNNHQGNISAFTEWRGFTSGMGTLSNTILLRRQFMSDYHDDRLVRLDTRWRLPIYQQGLTLEAGDTLTSALAWSRATRIGGIAIGSDFSQRPYETTAPLPNYFGEAAMPSSVELYIDGLRQYRGDVPAGPFQLTASPGVSYAGQAQVVVTDALGRSNAVAFPVYSTNRLLRPGLNEWSLELGKIRQDYGLKSFRYHQQLMGSATLRRGISQRLTLETHAEGDGERASGGMGAIWNPADSHLLTLSLAASRRGGAQYGAGYSWTGRRFNIAVDSLSSNAGYRDVASGYGGPPPQISQRALFGINIARATLGANLTRLRYRRQEDYRYAGLFATRSFNHVVSLSLGYHQNLRDSRDRSVFITISAATGRNLSWGLTSRQQQGQNYLTTDLSRSIDGERGVGWHLQGRRDRAGGGLAELNWLGERGEISLGASRYDSTSNSYAGARGALVMMGGHLFAAQRIDNAFAVVSTGEWPHVPILQDNRPIGTTDERGMLLIPRLNAWQDNRLAIDPLNLPSDTRINEVERHVAPAGDVGMLVVFPIDRIRAATLLLVDDRGKPLPVGAMVSTAEQQTPLPVGHDGMIYLETAAAGRQTLKVTLPDGSQCDVAFNWPAQNNGVPQLGPFTCLKGER